MTQFNWQQIKRQTSLFAIFGLLNAAAFAYPAHYFVIHEASDGSLSVASHQQVELAGEAPSSSPAFSPNRLDAALAVTVKDKTSGATRFTGTATGSAWLRGEFHGSHSEIDGHHLPLSEHDYVLRIPATAGGELQLQAINTPAAASKRANLGLTIDLDRFSTTQTASAAAVIATPSSGDLVKNGDPANRLDILMVAEGYTAAQQDQFLADAKRISDQFLSISPYADFKHLVNVSWMFVPSNQSGADKPACGETPNSPVSMVDTAFDGTFCTSGIRRLITVNTSKVYAAAANVPNWDEILVLVNDTEYGGSGGSVSVGTLNSYSVQIMQHEFGHTFTQLADEYTTAYPSFPACSDKGTTSAKCEPNVTDQADPAAIKWARWIASTTAIPTLAPLTNAVDAGLWEGARYKDTGMYRQCYNGMMRALTNAKGQTNSFCKVDGEAFVKRLYTGGWGLSTKGVSLIEPGALPAASKVVGNVGSCPLFQATVAGSITPNALTATWLVDGNTVLAHDVSHAASERFSYELPDALQHTVTLQVLDKTPLMLDKPVRSQSWTVQGNSVSDPERLMNWAEKKYPQFFSPAGQTTQAIGGFKARYFAGTDVWLGVKDCHVYVYGKVFNGLLDVGLTSDLIKLAASDGF